MKHQVLAITGCIAATASASSIANTLPENLLGLNLGEISTNSFINKPFKGVIPLSFTSYSNAKNLNVRLASQSIFNQIGAEKHPVLNSLNFQVTKQDGQPVILISSDQPIQLPFLNFILEIQGPEGVVYQDYTVLLDPESKQAPSLKKPEVYASVSNLSLKTEPKKKQKYKIKSGDTLSTIAKSQKLKNVSLTRMSQGIYKKNPRAFIRGDINKIKKGATLNLPTKADINRFEVASKEAKTQSNATTKKISKKINQDNDVQLVNAADQNTYTVVQGDTLSKITRKFANKDNSFTKLMNAIYVSNPDAFVRKNKSVIRKGVELQIPLMVEIKSDQNNSKDDGKNTITQSLEESQNISASSNDEISIDVEKTQKIADGYKVKQGDNLSSITKKIGHKNVPFAKMLKAIYQENPKAFVDNDISQLLVGAVISIPSLDKANQDNMNASELVKTKIGAEVVDTVSKDVPATELIKRIRELRKELKQSKTILSGMQKSLTEKETLLQKKNIQLDTLINNNVPNDQTVGTDKTLPSVELVDVDSIEGSLVKVSQVNTTFDQNNDLIEFSSIQEFVGVNYAYLTLASLFGLLLISYRRNNNANIYSDLDNFGSNYIPLPDDDKYVLRERNINYHDPKMDEEFSYGISEPDAIDKDIHDEIVKDPALTEVIDDLSEHNPESFESELSGDQVIVEINDNLESTNDSLLNSLDTEIVIDPLLTEATDDLSSIENNISLEPELINIDQVLVESNDDLENAEDYSLLDSSDMSNLDTEIIIDPLLTATDSLPIVEDNLASLDPDYTKIDQVLVETNEILESMEDNALLSSSDFETEALIDPALTDNLIIDNNVLDLELELTGDDQIEENDLLESNESYSLLNFSDKEGELETDFFSGPLLTETAENLLVTDTNPTSPESDLNTIEQVLAETNEYLENVESHSLLNSFEQNINNHDSMDEEINYGSSESSNRDLDLHSDIIIDPLLTDVSTEIQIDTISPESETLIDDLVSETNYIVENSEVNSLLHSFNQDIELHPNYNETIENLDVIENNTSTLNELVDEQKNQQIEQCDDLITEFYNGLGVDENIAGKEEWDNIEKVCDNYIDQYKETDTIINEDGLLVEGVADFNHMMTDLLESLDRADNNLKKTIADENLTHLLKDIEDNS